MDYVLILVGFALLIGGANYLVDGAVALARRLGISHLVIGLTVVALGTSAPELVVNLLAAADAGTTDLALTNVIGSNMINIFVILGVAAVIFPIVARRSSRIFDIPLSLLAPLLVFALVALSPERAISRLDAAILLAIFVAFMIFTIRKGLRDKGGATTEAAAADKPRHPSLAALMIVGGLTALVIGGNLIVDSATAIALRLGVSQSVIGLTIVALGTSLPELATSGISACKKNSDIALGNVIGSNIFNIFFILAISALVRPLPAYNNLTEDLLVVALGSLLVLLMVSVSKKHAVNRWGGVILLLVYAVYLVWTLRNV